ncbi:MAG: hypothetical protein ACYDEN_00965 [Acidimicrobiales bacterium]
MSEQGSSTPGASAAEVAAADGDGASGSTPGGIRPLGSSGGGRPFPGTANDWTVDVADKIESVVRTVRDKTTIPITKVVRGVVFGLVAAALGIVAAVFGIIGITRLVEVYLPIEPYSARVWGTYAVLGAIFLVVGAFCWSKRTVRKK